MEVGPEEERRVAPVGAEELKEGLVDKTSCTGVGREKGIGEDCESEVLLLFRATEDAGVAEAIAVCMCEVMVVMSQRI